MAVEIPNFMTKQGKIPADEFVTWLESLPEEDERRNWDLLNGEIFPMDPPVAKKATIGAMLLYLVGAYAIKVDAGYITGADGGFKIGKGKGGYEDYNDYFAPDAAFIAKAKLPDGLPDDDFFRVLPDLAVEVVSKSDQSNIHEKAMRYLALGIRMVWVAHAKRKTIEAYTPTENGAQIQVFKVGDTLTGGDVLPGFSVKVAEIFK
jgi:Uma2 family endonuclease